jgi:hypothetical protein
VHDTSTKGTASDPPASQARRYSPDPPRELSSSHRGLPTCKCRSGGRAANGHAAATPPSAIMNSRRRMWMPCEPPVRVNTPCNGRRYHALIARSVATSRSECSPLDSNVRAGPVALQNSPWKLTSRRMTRCGQHPLLPRRNIDDRFTSITGHNIGEFYLRRRPATHLAVMRG